MEDLQLVSTQCAESPKKSLKECVFVNVIVKNTLLQNAFSVILPTVLIGTGYL